MALENKRLYMHNDDYAYRLNYNQSLSLPKSLIAIVFLLIATFVLTPRFWEPTTESWKHWAAARILRETGGFPVFSRGPGYVVYLQLFQFFDFPLSIQLEYVITHLFVYTALFLMLQHLLPYVFALLFTCAWIPTIGQTEGSVAVAGIGFLALYLKNNMYPVSNNREYLPRSLLAATLCSAGYLFFLIGNIIGIIIERCIKKQPFFNFLPVRNKKQVFSLLFKSFLLLIFALTIFCPSRRWDHNAMVVDGRYMPVPQENGFTVAFFQLADWRYVTRIKKVPESSLYKQDWYFTHKEAFGGATTIMQGIRNNPRLFVITLYENIKGIARLPREFISWSYRSGPEGRLLTVFGLFLFPFGLFGMFRRLKSNGCIPFMFSIVVGALATVCALLLTSFNARYIIALLPVALLIDIYIGTEFWNTVKHLFKELSGAHLSQIKNSLIKFIVLGALFIFMGIVFNEEAVSVLFHKDLSWGLWGLLIRFLNIFFIMVGTFSIILVVYRFRETEYKYSPTSSVIFVMFLTILVLSFTKYPYGRKEQLKAVLNNRAFLTEGTNQFSMTPFCKQLLKSVNRNSSILALEDHWLKGFTKVNLDKIYNLYSLPPFSDLSGETEKFLSNLDVIWVNSFWTKKTWSPSTQIYLRYELHIEPFLRKKLSEGWVVEEVKGYGKIYHRPSIR